MIPSSVAAAYHEATKYTPENVSQAGGLDWETEPKPVREMPGAERLSLVEASTGRAGDGPEAASLGRLGRALYFTNGVTAVLRSPSGKLAMRAAPSAGALYPTEIYVAATGWPGLLDGVWNYQVGDHALALVRAGTPREDLARACAEHPAVAGASLVVVLTGVLGRSAWRYRERGYRRVLLDSGHVLGNLSAYAPVEGLAAIPLGGFTDDGITRLCDLGEGEVPLAVVPLVALGDADDLARYGRRALRSGPPVRPGDPDERVPSAIFFAEGEGTETLHAEGCLREEDLAGAGPFLGDVPGDQLLGEPHALRRGVALSGRALDLSGKERETIAKRRSCRRYEGTGRIRLEHLERLLAFAYATERKPGAGGPWFFDLGMLETYVAVMAVRDLEAGVYYYAPREAELRLVQRIEPGPTSAPPSEDGEGGLRARLYQIALTQELARDAAAVVFHAADLRRATRRYGERAYRYLGLDAGHLGQRLNLGAVRLGLGASGIGGYFDDDAAHLCGLDAERAIVYVTTLGVPAGA